MLEFRRRSHQHFIRHFHCRVHGRSAPRVESGYLIVEFGFIARRLHFADDVGIAIESDHRRLIAATEDLNGRLRSGLCHLDFIAPIEPDLSMTRAIASEGFSFSFSKSLRTGRISSSVVL